LPAAELDCTITASGASTARHGGDVAHQLIGLFAHHATTLEVFEDTVQQARIFEQVERGGAVLVVDGDLGRFRLQRLLDLPLLQFLQRAQHVPEIVFDGIFRQSHFHGGLLDEDSALAGRVEIERIDVEAVPAGGQQIHLQDGVAEILRQAAHTIAAVAQRDGDFVAFHLDGHGGGRRRSGS
jgi:hypothetical protein